MTLTTAGTTANVRVYCGATDNADGTVVAFSGNGTSGVYVWGAQASQGSIAGDYTPTTSAAVYGPRFDYDPVTFAAKGLLIEEQRTNLLTYSEQFDNAAWTKANATISANSTTAPDATVTADTITGSAGTAFKNVNQSYANTTGLVFSVFAKAGTQDKIQLLANGSAGNYANFNLTNGTVTATGGSGNTVSSIQFVGNGWYRCSIAVINSTLIGSPFVALVDSESAGYAASSTTVGTVYIWGAQLEAGAFATSYIPTVASTVTRSADVAQVNTMTPWYNATQGSLFIEYTIPFTSGNRYVASLDAGASNYIEIGGNTAGNTTNLYQRQGGTLDVSIAGASNVLTTSVNKLAARFGTNDFAYYLNGTSQGTDTSNTMVTGITSLEIGRYNEGSPGGYFGGHIRRIAYYPRKLTNAELQTLTA
jgi:hypothetical protein